MLKKTITYTNFDDEEVTEEHYFHLSKADIIEMQVSTKGGLEEHLKRVIQTKDGGQIIAVFKDLLARAYGQRVDGRFIKNKEKTEEFMSSEAYSELFMEMVTNADVAAEFVNGIVPKNLDKDVAKLQASSDANVVAQTVSEPAPVEAQILTRVEAIEMDQDELQSGLATGRYKIGPQ